MSQPHLWRTSFVTTAWWVVLLVLIGRLGYWQLWKSAELQAEAQEQYIRTTADQGERGSILTADGYVLVGNTQAYRLVANARELGDSANRIVESLSPILAEYTQVSRTDVASTLSAQLAQAITQNSRRTVLAESLTPDIQKRVETLQLPGLGWEPYKVRAYREASMAAQILGFVGKNDQSLDVGYFGVEGGLDRELRGKTARHFTARDATGVLLWGSSINSSDSPHGRDVTLTIRRDVQQLLERTLEEGITQYGASSGEVAVMDPQTGAILGVASWPQFEPWKFQAWPAESYKLPGLTNAFEPGSIFKPLTVAAGVDAGLIGPNTQCPSCGGPRIIDGYTIKTWNNVYHDNLTMTEALAESDNIAMIYIAESLGAEKFREYLKKFKIGDKIDIELQGDTPTPFAERWGPAELATSSFGQGISTTSLQMLRAIGALANQGELMRPQIVAAVSDPQTGEVHKSQPVALGQAVTPATARTVTDMLVAATKVGESKWTSHHRMKVAGKTGTAQVALGGTYDTGQSNASYVGYAPADNPRFVMIVKLSNPAGGAWASQTAAPLWFEIAEKLYVLLDVAPDAN
jgi:stage V sporulation protein D (sporulation-specific penicillin-binding protein)